MPKIHNIHIRREGDHPGTPSQPPRPRSAMSTTTICSETSVDFEVQNILGSKFGSSSKNKTANNSNESQEIIIDFDSSLSQSSANNSFVLNNSKVINGVKRSQTFNNRKNLDIHDNFHGSKGYYDKNSLSRAHSMTRSSAERSLDEMSLYDQMCIQQKSKKSQKKDPRVEEYRNLVLAEIKSTMSRSLSESDLSDLGGHSPSPSSPTASESHTLETSDGEIMNNNKSGTMKRRDIHNSHNQPRSRSSPGVGSTSTPSSGYSELTSSSGN